MKRSRKLVAVIVVAVVLVVLAVVWKSIGFNVNVSVNSGPAGFRYSGAGVTFIMPMETAKVISGPGGIDYKSDDLAAATDGRTLVVNGKVLGALTAGDTVDFTEPGKVKVNGAVRSGPSP